MEIELINDYYNSVIFHEYVKNNNYLNNILQKEITNLYEQITLNNNDINNIGGQIQIKIGAEAG